MRSHNALSRLCFGCLVLVANGLVAPLQGGSFVELNQVARDDAAEHTEFLTSYASDDILPTSKTVSVQTSSVATGVALIAPSLSDVEPHTEGFIVTTVSNPAETTMPLMTSSIPTPTSLLQPAKPTATSTSSPHDASLEKRATNIFAGAIDTSAPLAMFKRRSDHPVPRKGITKKGPIGTNKFYSNFFLGDQTSPVFTFPYSLAWSAGKGPAASWGMAISHIDADQLAYGPVEYNKAVKYFINPVGIQSMIISAKELGKKTVLTTDSITAFSIKANLRKDSKSAPIISFPVTQGMMFTTASFTGGTPQIQTGVFFKKMTKVSKDPKSNVRKYNFLLEDGTTWRLYAYKIKGSQLDLQLVNNGLAQAKKPFTGYIQIAKDPNKGDSQTILDTGSGVFPSAVSVSGSVSGAKGSYTLKWTRAGHSAGALYTFALPHHVSSFDATTKSHVRNYQLRTTTKGMGTAVAGTSWTMVEPSMPVSLGFAPWDQAHGSRSLSKKAKDSIKSVAALEISQDMDVQINLNSMYYSGKALTKFGNLVYVINNLLGDTALAQAGLSELKNAFKRFSTNKQQFPLYYESAWGGLVSSASYETGDSGYDFGNTYYNDHHFHYGYHILAAAYIGSMDAAWLKTNKAYVNNLVRDIANPSSSDTYFPQWRSFDWYHGHSWATGLFDQLDGKNQESSSEDMMAAYAIKMWGQVVKDANMVARANLQLAVMSRSLQQYYLYTSNNVVQPKKFIGNKVAGILFENKIDHTTFFDAHIEAIQGIHMIPLLPSSTLARTGTFVKQEWDVYFNNGRIDKIDNAWKGVVYSSYATIEPKKAWDFFNSSKFDAKWLDGGASRAWYLAYAAALGGI